MPGHEPQTPLTGGRLSLRRWRRSWLESHDLLRQVVLALVVGTITAAGAIVFRWMIDSVHTLFFVQVPPGSVPLPLLVGLGGLLVGLLVWVGAREAQGHGVPEVIMAVAMKGGRIRGRVAVVKALASAITLGSGGSAGREGPIVQIGAALGSKLGQLLHSPEERVILLVACGSAAGISATFNAPIAGVFFALEVILGEFATRSFSMVVLSSVTASAISRAALGNVPAFVTPGHTLVHPAEFGWYLGLGLVAGLVGVLYTRTLYLVEDGFDGLRLPAPLKPALGGLAVGVLALWFPQVMGNGYEVIEGALASRLDLSLMALLVLAKIAATALTLGSGGSGGTFAPALYIGAVLGGAFGGLVTKVAPHPTAPAGAYALVGMAAVFAASARAPLTAVLMLFELTGDYRIILPLMAATVLATTVSSVVDRESIYSVKLKRRGLDLSAREKALQDPMRRVSVAEVMTRDFQTVSPDLPVGDLVELFNRTGHHGFPVVDAQGRLQGMVALKDLEYARLREHSLTAETKVRRLATSEPGYVCPEDSLALALRTMGRLGVGRLPVVDSGLSRRLVGLLRRSDIIAAYNRESEAAGESASALKVRTTFEAEFLEIVLPPTTPWEGQTVRSLPIPEQAVLVAVRRAGETLIPRGGTVLNAGDVVVAFSRPETRTELRRVLGAPAPLPEG